MDATQAAQSTTPASQRRRTVVINPSFQWKYTFLFMAVAFIVSALMSVTLFGVHFSQARSRALALLKNPDAPPSGEVMMLLVFSALGFATVAAAAVGLWTIFFTHRISGPVFIMQRWLDQLAGGRLPRLRPLRKKDEFKAFHATLESAVEFIRRRERENLNRLTELSEQVRATSKGEELAARIDVLRHEAAELLGEPLDDSSANQPPDTSSKPASPHRAETFVGANV